MFEISPDGQGITKPGDDTEERRAILAKTTNYLFDNLSVANDRFFRKLTAGAITDAEYGQIQILAAANFLRYIIHTNVAKESVGHVIDNIIFGMKEAPPHVERPENEEIDAINAEIEAKKSPKIIIDDEIHAPKTGQIVTGLVN